MKDETQKLIDRRLADARKKLATHIIKRLNNDRSKPERKETLSGYWISEDGHQCFINGYVGAAYCNVQAGIKEATGPENKNVLKRFFDSKDKMYVGLVTLPMLKTVCKDKGTGDGKDCIVMIGTAAYPLDQLILLLETFLHPVTMVTGYPRSVLRVKADNGYGVLTPLIPGNYEQENIIAYYETI